MKWINQRVMLLMALAGVGFIIVLGYFWIQPTTATPKDWHDEKQIESTITQGESTNGSSQEKEKKSDKMDSIMVDIKGAVKNPGVYEVRKDARMHQLVAVAGGLTEIAEAKSINLASKLVDQQLVYIPIQGESVPQIEGQSQQNHLLNSEEKNKKININEATISDLQTINGVGEKKAQAIIDYRTKNGKFSSIDQLTEVDGFGKKTVEKLRESITI